MMIRSFLPVGQGAFYRETFKINGDKINIIYDCGSATDIKIVENRILQDFGENETIHAVFISHFDDDHINGLPFLFKHCDVKNLFIPLITTEDSIYLKLKNIVKKNSFTVSFLNDPHSFLQNSNTRLIQIIPYKYKQNDYIPLIEDTTIIESGKNVSDYIFEGYSKYGKEDTGSDIDWEYIPFNFRRDERIKELKNALKEVFAPGSAPSDDELVSNYLIYKDKIIASFKKVKGSFNTNSMVLFSGIKSKHIRQSICQFIAPTECQCHGFTCNNIVYHRCYHFKKPNGCLYTGDYDASGKEKWRELYDAYLNYWDYIGCIQIPHHGSKHNYNSQFSEFDSYKIISAGSINKYDHPHSFVIKDLLLNLNQVYIVNEKRNSQVDILCNF